MTILENEDINLVDQDPLYKLMNKLCVVRTKTDRFFIAKLIFIKNNELYFENKNGNIIMDDRSEIANMHEFQKKAVV